MSKRLYTLYRISGSIKLRIDKRLSPSGRRLLTFMLLAMLFGFNTQLTMMYQLAALTFALFLLAFPLAMIRSPKLRIRRVLPETCTAGEPLTYRLELYNDDSFPAHGVFFKEQPEVRWPVYEEFINAVEENEDQRSSFDRKFGYYRWLWLINQQRGARFETWQLPDVKPKDQVDMEVSLTPLRRGYIQLAGYTYHRLDPFGLFKQERTIPEPGKILVLPRLYPVEWRELNGSRKHHQGGMSSAANIGESGEFAALREYRQGDPVKHIDWKATARSGNPIVRQYRDEYFSRYGVVLDTFCDKTTQHFEDAVSVAASIILRQDAGKSRIDLLFASNNCVSSITMGQGGSGQRHILETLACIAPCRTGTFRDLTHLITTHSPVISGLFMVLLAVDKERKKLIDYLTACSIPCSIILISANPSESKRQLENQQLHNVAVFDIHSSVKSVHLP